MRFKRLIRITTLLVATGLAAVLLSSCGGGVTVAGGGVGGTGISTGSITGFGSIWVNGVEFDTDSATFSRDGETAANGQDDYSIGEVVTIVGTINSDGVSGTADDVIFNDLLEGPITEAPEDNNDHEFKVLEQLVLTDDGTVFHNFTQLSDLDEGNIVEVSGYRNADNNILATSIKLTDDSHQSGEGIELKGFVANVDTTAKTFEIGDLTIDYENAELSNLGNDPQNGQYVEVHSEQPINGNILIASRVEPEGEPVDLSAGDEVEVEGLITGYTSGNNNFTVNGQTVQVIDGQTVYTREGGGSASKNDLDNNVLIEAEGTINGSGVLVADQIEFKQ